MKKICLLSILVIAVFVNISCSTKVESKKMINLPDTFNSPASAAIDKAGDIYFTSPNFHNDALIKAGEMKKATAPTIGKIDKNDELSTWYTFQPEDMEKTSGKVAPMGIAFGPDGNAYVADMQLWFKGESRILRIVVEDGRAVRTEVVAVGFSFPNAVIWKGSDLFISDTVLGETEDGKQISGVYKINMSELDATNPLHIKAFVSEKDHDSHVFETFVSNAKLHFGANGLAMDGEGNLYTGIMEEGSVLKTTMDENNNAIETKPFAKGMKATDGMHWNAATNKIYITDLFDNAVYSIDMSGQLELLAQNADSNGSNGELDGPSEVIVRGDKAYVMNFDAVFDSPEMINKTADSPHNLSVIKLK